MLPVLPISARISSSANDLLATLDERIDRGGGDQRWKKSDSTS